MRFEFDYHENDPALVQAEAQRQIAFQLSRIADVLEERDAP